jgi:phage terminase large subunit
MEGCTRVWCEEAQNISKRSWDILIPTIRSEGSEIWLTFNPDLDSDVTYRRFVINPPDDCIVAKLNYSDNPWFNEVLEKERQHCLKYAPDDYDNIWEGKCRPAVEGAIYFKQIQEAEAQGRICNVPHDPMLKTHIVLDLGWDDSLAAGLVQRHSSEVRVIEYLEASHTGLDVLSAELRTRPYNWGSIVLPHDGFSGSLNSGGKSTFSILRALGWKVPTRNEIVELSIEEGIRNARLVFPRIYFDKTKCAALKAPAGVTAFKHTDLSWRLVECLKRYRRHVNKEGTSTTPVKDAHAHGADMLRYLCANAEHLSNENEQKIFHASLNYSVLDAGVGY